jgi:hypothetical protein
VPDKPRERFYLAALRKALPDIPSGDPEEREPPDFVLTTADRRRLGIELTTFHLPPPLGEQPHQERQSLKEHIVAVAERVHHAFGGPALYVSVFFDLRRRFLKKDIQPLAYGIAVGVLTTPAPSSVYESVEVPRGRRPDATWSIRIRPSINGVDKLWHADMGGWVADIGVQHVADRLRAKAQKAPEARTRCDELWLVIVNDAVSGAAPAEISTEAIEAVYDAPFDRLIWLIPEPPRAIELRLMSSATRSTP